MLGRRDDSRADASQRPETLAALLRRPGRLWPMLREYLGVGARRRQQPVADAAALRVFLETRSSFIAQTTLYGYLRTRAGSRYPELFDNDGFAASINVAKWQMWLACLSDLSVYAGGLLARDAPGALPAIGGLMRRTVDRILADTGHPADAGPDFESSAAALRRRIEGCDWSAVGEEEAFSESPPALVRWAPVIDSLKEVDAPIVLNSVRFRWQEVRRDLRQSLNAAAVLAG